MFSFLKSIDYNFTNIFYSMKLFNISVFLIFPLSINNYIVIKFRKPYFLE